MTSWKMLGKFRVKVYLNLKIYFSFKLKNEIIKTGVPRMRHANGFLCRDGGGSLGGAYLQQNSLTVNNWLHRWGRDLGKSDCDVSPTTFKV